ncbi:fibroblast growth factor receptor 1-A [Nelusetta ayraudi]|uniref:fibroblast growth factor receptor 1-A n=1 Tax=Nelusetta ayraudi TaxID=303726 RepID=UPI003F72C3E0
MKVLLLLAVVVLIHGNYATLVIKGPTGPVLEGQKVILECQYKDSELNISEVRFEKSYKPSGRWSLVFRYHSRCFSALRAAAYAKQIGNSLFFDIPYVTPYNEGLYRCFSTNESVTAPDNSSQELSMKVHYLHGPSVSSGENPYRRVDRYLSVKAGDDVELKCGAPSSEEPTFTWTKNGSDWILPSSTLILKEINALDAGVYTCLAEHPLFPSLSKNLSITLRVFDRREWLNAQDGEGLPLYKPISGEMWAMMTAGAVCLVVFVLSISIFLCRKFGKARTSKGPIDDHSQKKPIYKTSVDSLPSTCGDVQPLV